jgi:NADP-dependent 3-hydroxy acid dehydrogenase YdfG
MSNTLTGRVALVTGASSGLGEATALALAEAGVKVAVSARREDRLAALVAKIKAAGGEAIALVGDVTDEAMARDAVTQTVKQWGRIDILVNSAGAMQLGTVENANIAHWRNLMDLNLFATLYTCTEAIKHMRAQGGGDIINISSTAGRRARPQVSPYSTSKVALNAMTECMRQEVGALGIRVCVVEPGSTTTEISENIEDAGMREMLRNRLNRDGAMKPEDVAAAIMLAVSLPPRANLAEILIIPTSDNAPM